MTQKQRVIKRIRNVLRTYGSLANRKTRKQNMGKLIACIMELPEGSWEDATLKQLKKFEFHLTELLRLSI